MTTILAIEDESQIRENIQEILCLEGFNVLTAAHGKIGLQLAQEHIPDLIVCDVMMPELDGHQVLLALRQDPNTIRIPFIFLSANAAKADFRKGMSLGADDYLTKPFTHNELLEAISTRLDKQQQILQSYTQELKQVIPTSPSNDSSVKLQVDEIDCGSISVKVIKPTGMLDIKNCHELRREIIDSAQAGCSNILLDCQDLTFIDSSGLAALVLSHQNSQESNSKLSICSINQEIQMLFELTNLIEILDVFPSLVEFRGYYSNLN
jgi:anti-anti-sigma factor